MKLVLLWLLSVLFVAVIWPGRRMPFGLDDLIGSSGVWNDDPPQVDSFSEPAVAAAILQKHVRNLFEACLLTHKPGATRMGRSGTGTGAESNSQIPNGPDVSADARWDSARSSDEQSLGALDRRLRALRSESLQSLLVIHCQNCSWNDFLDTYLELLAVAPDKAATRCWMREALNCSLNCGRTEEVLDALRHATRFSKNSKVVGWIRTFLEDWTLEKIQGPPVDSGTSVQYYAQRQPGGVRPAHKGQAARRRLKGDDLSCRPRKGPACERDSSVLRG